LFFFFPINSRTCSKNSSS